MTDTDARAARALAIAISAILAARAADAAAEVRDGRYTPESAERQIAAQEAAIAAADEARAIHPDRAAALDAAEGDEGAGDAWATANDTGEIGGAVPLIGGLLGDLLASSADAADTGEIGEAESLAATHGAIVGLLLCV